MQRDSAKIKGIDYDEVLAPVARYSTLRRIMAFEGQEGLHVIFLEVKASFSNRKLYEVIYIQQPEGCIEKEKRTCL